MQDAQQNVPEQSNAATTLLLTAVIASLAGCGVGWAAGARYLGLTAGTTAAAAGSAVMVSVLGAAAGAFLGRRRPGTGSILLRQATLALALALAPAIYIPLRLAYLFLWPLLVGVPVGEFLLRSLLAAGLVLAPAAAIGSLVASLTATIRQESQDAAQWPGLLLCLAGAGFGLGLAVGGLVLVPSIGLLGAWCVAMAMAGLGASVTFLWARAPGGGTPARAWPVEAATPGVAVWRHMAALGAGFFLASAYAGWERTLALIAGPTSGNAVLALALLFLGLAVGGFIAVLFGKESGPGMAALALAGAALVVQGSMYLVPWLAETYLGLAPQRVPAGEGIVLSGLVSLVMIVPGAVMTGLALALGAARPRTGSSTDVVLAGLASFGLGAVAATLATPLLLVPAFGIRRTVALAAATGLLAAVVLLGELPSRWSGTRSTATVALLALMVVAGGFPASWDPRVVAGGLYRYAGSAPERFGSTDAWLQDRLRGEAPLFYREGSEATVVVGRTVQSLPGMPDVETLVMTIDGRTSGSSGMDLRSQVLSGEIPLLLHGSTDKVLVIDFLTGVTAGSVLRHPVTSLRIIEREPAVLAAGGLFREMANAPLDDGRVGVVRDDPRARLLVDRTRYGVILVSGLDPWQPRLGDLVTREGYALLRERLEDGGILAQRVSLSAAPEAATRTMLRTFARTFASVLVFQMSPDDILVVGSDRPLRMDAASVRSLVAMNPGVAADIRRVVAIGPNEIFMTLRLGDDALRRLLGDGPLNDDDRAVVSVAAARDLSVHDGGGLARAIEGAWNGFGPLLTDEGETPADKAEFLYNLAKSYLGLGADPTRALDIAKELAGMGETAKSRWVTGEARLQQKDIDGAVQEWESVLAVDPDDVDALFSLGTFYLDSRDYFAADRYLARAAKSTHETPAVLYHYGRNLVQLGHYAQAIDVLRRAREVGAGHESYPLVDYLVGLSQLRLHQNAEAAQSLKDYLDWAYQQSMLTRVEVDAHLKRADALEASGKRFDALQERRKADELKERIDAYARTQDAGGGGASSGGAQGGAPVPVPSHPAPAAPGGPPAVPRGAAPSHGG